jgi:hypothetical protein
VPNRASESDGQVIDPGCENVNDYKSTKEVVVGFYAEQVLPRLQDKAMARKAMGEVRSRVCAGLRGKVVEIGFGTGLNARGPAA